MHFRVEPVNNFTVGFCAQNILKFPLMATDCFGSYIKFLIEDTFVCGESLIRTDICNKNNN